MDRDLSFTKISTLPTKGLRRLSSLNVEGCKDLHRFPNAEGPFDEELCTNKTFPFLEDVRFEYHAHCCLYSNFKPLKQRAFLLNTHTTLTCDAEGSDKKRHISRIERSSSMYSCISLQNGTIINDYVPNNDEIYMLDQLCEVVTYCFENRCPDNCLDDISASGSGLSIFNTNIACVSNEGSVESVSLVSSQSTALLDILSSTISTSSTSQSFSSIESAIVSTSTTGIELESVSNTVTITTTICWIGTSLISPMNSIVPSPTLSPEDDGQCCTTIEYALLPTITQDIVCTSNIYNSVSSLAVSSPTNLPVTDPPVTDPPVTDPLPTECDEFEDDEFEECYECTEEICEMDGCEKYQSVCDELGRRKRSIDCLMYDCISDECDEFKHLCLLKRQQRNANNMESLSQCSATQINVMPSVSFTLVCSETQTTSGTSNILSPSPTDSPVITDPPVTDPPVTDPLPTECDEFEDDEFEECYECTEEICEMDGCEKYQSVCDELGRKKRSIDCLMYDCISDECNEFKHLCLLKRQQRNIDDLMKCNSNCTVSMISVFTQISPSTIGSSSIASATSSTGTSTTTTTTTVTRSPVPTENVGENPYCTPPPFFEHFWYYESSNISSCYPGNDPFNPCFHILDDDILRVAIWIVFFIAIGGNGIVIVVTTLQWCFKNKSSKKEVNLLYVLYLNLAFADLFTGLYLCTIASIDMNTKGHYSEGAIDWQTGSGCAFAGFCAIFSSILSIYTLLVITIERVYSIKFALQKRHFKKHWVVIIMTIGWLLAIILAILPYFGLSSYSRVSICLPFETRGVEDKVYITFVLSITGLASFFILLSYIYLFYIVGCSANKRLLTRSLSAREEMKLAFRMSLLIFTDFATWAPIALFGLSAAFGYPLINNIKAAKVLMVFVFPLNSCLNPILYSFSTRLFRSNISNMARKCGMCMLCDKCEKSILHSYTIKDTSMNSSSDGKPNGSYLGQRRGTQISILSRLTSVSSLGSNSRRNSTFSGSSIEEGSESRKNSVTDTPSMMERDKYPSFHPLSQTHRDSDTSLTSLNLTRLKSLQEEEESNVVVNHTMEIRRKNSTESNGSTSFQVITNRDVTDTNEKDLNPAPTQIVSRRRHSVPTLPDILETDCNKISGLNKSNTVMLADGNGLVLFNRTVINENEIQEEVEMTSVM